MTRYSYAGIDVGWSGGIARIDDGWEKVRPFAVKFEGLTGRDLAYAVSNALRSDGHHVRMVLLEKAQAFPGQGVISMFRYGEMFGMLQGILNSLDVPWDFVRPQEWQKAMKCLTHGDKNISKAKAQRLFPGVQMTHAIADALLIAEFCRRKMGGK